MKPILLQWENGPVWPKGFLWHVEFTREMQGYIIPCWYLGHSYIEYSCDVSHYYVIPLNLLIAFGRWCWFGVRYNWARFWAIPEKWRD